MVITHFKNIYSRSKNVLWGLKKCLIPLPLDSWNYLLILISFKINTKRFHVRTRNRFMKENTVCFIYIVGLSWPTLYINSGPLLMHIKLGFLMIVFMNSKSRSSRVHTNDYHNQIEYFLTKISLLYEFRFSNHSMTITNY